MANQQPNIEGHWRGYYVYPGHPRRHAFAAVFFENGGSVQGSILDDDIACQASIAGAFSFPEFTFTKIYDRPDLMPVQYQGLLSDDGNTLSGVWRIGLDVGSWVATRDSAQAETKAKDTAVGKKRKVKNLV